MAKPFYEKSNIVNFESNVLYDDLVKMSFDELDKWRIQIEGTIKELGVDRPARASTREHKKLAPMEYKTMQNMDRCAEMHPRAIPGPRGGTPPWGSNETLGLPRSFVFYNGWSAAPGEGPVGEG